jgi:hypothetical protein
MSDLYTDIIDMLRKGTMTFDEIATALDIPKAWVIEAAMEANNKEGGYDEPMGS